MKCTILEDFAQELFAITFDQKPNYSKLRFLLTKEMLNIDLIPNDKFDWNDYVEQPTGLSDFNDSQISKIDEQPEENQIL